MEVCGFLSDDLGAGFSFDDDEELYLGLVELVPPGGGSLENALQNAVVGHGL